MRKGGEVIAKSVLTGQNVEIDIYPRVYGCG